MFTLCRVVNSIIAIIILLGLIVASALGSISIHGAAIVAMPIVLLVCDFGFRKRNSSNDLVFAGGWTLWYLYEVAFIVVPRWYFLYVNALQPEDTRMLFWIIAIDTAVFVVPFLANGIYFLRLLLPKRSAI